MTEMSAYPDANGAIVSSSHVAATTEATRPVATSAGERRRFLVGLFAAVLPFAVSAYLHPWLHPVEILAPNSIQLSKDGLVELARVNSIAVYVTNIETFVTPLRRWPAGAPLRDTFIIEVPPREFGVAPRLNGNVDWVSETIKRMFGGTLDIEDVRRTSYERAVSDGEHDAADLRMNAAVNVVQALEPIDAEVPYGRILYHSLPPDLEFAKTTGIKHILALAAQLSSGDRNSKFSWATPASLAGHANEVFREAKAHGAVGVALPLIGAGNGDRSEPDVFTTLLTAAFDEGQSPGSLRAIYIGLFRRTSTAASDLLAKFNVAWLNFYPDRQKVGELADAPWRLMSLICLFSFLADWRRWRTGAMPPRGSVWTMTLAVLLLSRGLSEVVFLPVQWVASQGVADVWTIVSAVVLSALVGVNLSKIVLFDPKDWIRKMTEVTR